MLRSLVGSEMCIRDSNPPQPGDEEKLAAQRQARQNITVSSLNASEKPSGDAAAQMQKQIYTRLQELRQKLAVKARVRPYQIAGDPLLKTIAQQAPATLEELNAIPGFRTSGLAQEAVQILTMIEAIRMNLQSKGGFTA